MTETLVLQKPPGYRDPYAPAQPLPKPPQRRPIPPSSMHPKNQKKKSNRGSCCRTCCCCFSIFILVLIPLILAAGAIFYLWFDPKIPIFHFQSFEVPLFDVAIKSDGTYLNAKTVARVEVKNPNPKLGLYYGNTHVTATIGGGEVDEIELGSAKVPAFSQEKRNVTNLKVETEGKNLEVADGAGPRLRSGFKNGGLAVKVDVQTRVGVKVGDWKVGTVAVNVKCSGSSLKALQADGDMPKCTIHLLKWINIH